MIRINLLPWREARRKAERKHLAMRGGMVAVLGVAIVILVNGLLATQLAFQNDRNEFLKKENARLDTEMVMVEAKPPGLSTTRTSRPRFT